MKFGILTAIVEDVSDKKMSKTSNFYRTLTLTVNGSSTFKLNAWDGSCWQAGCLQKGDFIQAKVEDCSYLKPTKKSAFPIHNYKIKDLKKINATKNLGLYAQGQGVITSLDVHKASGKGKQFIAIDKADELSKRIPRRPYRTYLTVDQQSLWVDILNNKDEVDFCGLIDPSVRDRLFFIQTFNIERKGIQDAKVN